MGSSVILRPWLTLGVGFDQEAAEIRNAAVDFVDLGLPPRPHGRIEWICALQCAQFDRGAEARAQIDLDTVGTQDSGQRFDLPEVGLRQNESVGVDVRQHRAVDPYRCARARVVGVARVVIVRKGEPVPDRTPRVATFHGPVQVVPVVEDPVLDFRGRRDVYRRQGLMGLYQPEEMKSAVQHADISVCRNRRGAVAPNGHCDDAIAFGAR